MPRSLPKSLPVVLLIAAALSAGRARPAVAQPAGLEVETRGPIHEAFAEPVFFDPQPGMVIPRQPPEPINEIPPDERPEGDMVSWISGYWSWDDDRDSFLWVSGVWRSIPPGRQFVPGYWAQATGGHQWIPGFWLNQQVQTVEYLPPPPEPLSMDPIGMAPASDHTWIPGMWVWRPTGYVWRPGYWLAPQPNWVWVPPHYVWTPSGCIYISGYWDYVLPRRGLLFAPVYVPPPMIARPAFVYTPHVVIESHLVVNHLFARPRYHHYYFGDYYAADYSRMGILPVHTLYRTRVGYSPLYAHYRSLEHRRDPHWEDRYIRDFDYRRAHADARPPRTFAAMQRMSRERRDNDDVRTRNLIARPLDQYARDRNAAVRVQPVAPDRRERLREQGEDQLRRYQRQRRDLEVSSAARGPLRSGSGSGSNGLLRQPSNPQAGTQTPTAGSPARPLRLTLPRSPVAGQQAGETPTGTAPPPTPRTPRVDPNVKPRSAQPRNVERSPNAAQGGERVNRNPR